MLKWLNRLSYVSLLNPLDSGDMNITSRKNLAVGQATGICCHAKIWLRAKVMGICHYKDLAEGHCNGNDLP